MRRPPDFWDAVRGIRLLPLASARAKVHRFAFVQACRQDLAGWARQPTPVAGALCQKLSGCFEIAQPAFLILKATARRSGRRRPGATGDSVTTNADGGHATSAGCRGIPGARPSSGADTGADTWLDGGAASWVRQVPRLVSNSRKECSQKKHRRLPMPAVVASCSFDRPSDFRNWCRVRLRHGRWPHQ